MAKIVMNGFTVHNVEPCPNCNSEKIARIDDIMGMVQICCEKCDFVAEGAILLRGRYNLHTERDKFI